MYTLEQKQLAVETYNKLKSLRKTIYCLGYPGGRSTLQLWINEYNNTGQISRKTYKRVKNKYTDEQMRFAINYCVQNEMNITKTCKELGYPCRTVLSKWLDEGIPDRKKSVLKGSNLRKYSYNDKIVASIRFACRGGSATEIIKDTGISRSSLNKWKKQLIPLGERIKMTNTDVNYNNLQEQISDLKEQALNLQHQVHKLQLEKDALEKATETI